VVDGATVASARQIEVDISEALRRHDTSPALWRLGDGALVTHSISLLDLRVAVVEST
jgi:hypothetical protein